MNIIRLKNDIAVVGKSITVGDFGGDGEINSWREMKAHIADHYYHMGLDGDRFYWIPTVAVSVRGKEDAIYIGAVKDETRLKKWQYKMVKALQAVAEEAFADGEAQSDDGKDYKDMVQSQWDNR